MIKQKITPGYRYFHCDDCNYTWREKCRDVDSPSGSSCQKCLESEDPDVSAFPVSPVGRAYHPEWNVDKNGNLIDEG